jgi:hypothetical protein
MKNAYKFIFLKVKGSFLVNENKPNVKKTGYNCVILISNFINLLHLKTLPFF